MKFTLPKIPKKANAKSAGAKMESLRRQHNQAYADGDYPNAYALAFQAHQLAPKVVAPLQDAMVSAIMGKMWQQAVTCGLKILQLNPADRNAKDGLSHAYFELGEKVLAARYGLQSLQQSDNAVLADDFPILSPTAAREGKKIIAFSLYGANSKYLEAAVINAQIAPKIYPDWRCRFYLDESVPQHAVMRLQQYGAEVVYIDEQARTMPGTMWRFLALDDETVAYAIFRDCDSVISAREAKAVNEWLASGKMFHTMRDHGAHTELILAGMWGAQAGVLPNMRQLMLSYIANETLDKRFADQYFLRKHIWGLVRQSLCAHDSVFGFKDAVAFPSDREGMTCFCNVGKNESTGSFNAKAAKPDGTKVIWRLYSRIDPFINEDLSYRLFEQERLICEYESEIIHQTLSASVPQRYYRGFAKGESRVEISIQV